MNKNIFGLLMISFVSIHSIHHINLVKIQEDDIIKKNNTSCSTHENRNQPTFEYMVVRGKIFDYSQKEVEKYIKTSYWMTSLAVLNAIALVILKEANCTAETNLTIFGGLLAIDVWLFFKMKDFQHRGGQWLKALKEKELSLKNEN